MPVTRSQRLLHYLMVIILSIMTYDKIYHQIEKPLLFTCQNNTLEKPVYFSLVELLNFPTNIKSLSVLDARVDIQTSLELYRRHSERRPFTHNVKD